MLGHLARRSSRSTSPFGRHATTTTRIRQRGRRRVGAVRAHRRDQADVAVRVAAGGVVVGDGQQSGVLPCEPALGCSEIAS